MKKKAPRPTDGGGNWMDTYGDMVTLLLCFFVMLYSMSSLDAAKWDVFVRSIYPNGVDSAEEVTVNSPVGDDNTDTQGGTPETPELPVDVNLDELYLTIAERMNEMGIDGVTLSRGDGYTYVKFEDRAFFAGDSSTLTEQGLLALNVFCEAIAPVSDKLQQINIMAHTAQGDPGRPNHPRTDRMLSAMRAAEVCIFIQSKDVVAPEKLVDISYGQFRPIFTNDTPEGRAGNRRVELLLIDEGATVRSMEEYYEEYRSGVNADRTITTDGQPVAASPPFSEVKQPSPEAKSSLLSPLTDGEETPSAETEVSSGAAADGEPEAGDLTDAGPADGEPEAADPAATGSESGEPENADSVAGDPQIENRGR